MPPQPQSNLPPQRYPLAPLVDRWSRVLEQAEKTRHQEFGRWAEEAMHFFDGPTNYMWDAISETLNKAGGSEHRGFLAPNAHLPEFRMSVNRLFEAVALFGPALYYQAPDIAVAPRRMPEVDIEAYYAMNQQASQVVAMIPGIKSGMITDQAAINAAMMVQQEFDNMTNMQDASQSINDNHSRILEALANYAQIEGDKQTEGRLAITEAIITGLGLLETRVEVPPGGGPKMPRSRFLSYKDLLVDPDAKYWRDVTWIAIRTIAPVNQVEQEFQLRPGQLKGQYARGAALLNKSAIGSTRHGDGKSAGTTHDLVEYWTVYSKNGAGQNIKLSQKDKKIAGLEIFGDFVKLVVCKNCKYPLNLPQQVLQSGDQELIIEKASWEVPYWDDYAKDGGWPISRLCFYNKPGQTWPISMVKPCIGEMRFINWCMSFLADKVSAGSQIYVATMKQAGESIRSQLTGGKGPYTVIELEKIVGDRIENAVSFLKSPDFSMDIWRMVEEVNQQIDKRLGLNELLYGLSKTQMRSATEANVRQENISIRPDDMATRVEEWLATSAIREVQAYRYTGEYEDVLPVLGPAAAQVFMDQILTTDVSRITRDFNYRIVAGTAKKPNKITQIENLTDFGQYFLPVAQMAMSMGVVRPINAYLDKIGTAMDMDVDEFMLLPEDQMLMQQQAMAQVTQAEAAAKKAEQGGASK